MFVCFLNQGSFPTDYDSLCGNRALAHGTLRKIAVRGFAWVAWGRTTVATGAAKMPLEHLHFQKRAELREVMMKVIVAINVSYLIVGLPYMKPTDKRINSFCVVFLKNSHLLKCKPNNRPLF